MKSTFKVLLLTFGLVFLFAQCEKEEPLVNLNEPYFTITDQAFLDALIDEGVDLNGDGLISDSEAEIITNLNLDDKSISDMTGIEGFVNLEILWCDGNQLTSLDVSNNVDLIALSCPNNQLESLDVTKNSDLSYLWCYENQLTSLDVSKNIALNLLECDDNQLESLDVSFNIALTALGCSNNQLSNLDVSNNPALMGLHCGTNQLSNLDLSKNINLLTHRPYSHVNGLELTNMPSLYKICVFVIPFPPENAEEEVDITGSPNVYFTTECSK